jgi:tetratricopeptide (TPR) repeat protein
VLEKTGQINYSMKQYKQAINAYAAIIDNFPGSSRIFFRRGLVWQQSGNLQNALSDLDNAVMIDPGQYPYFYFRAGIRNQLGEKDGYMSDLMTAANLLNRERSVRKLDKAEQDMLNSINNLLKQ